MGFYCKVCGKWKDIGTPPFCSFDCQHKFNEEQTMKDFQNTLKSINAAQQTAYLARQTELMEQQQRQAQIAAAQERQAALQEAIEEAGCKNAKEYETIKEFGFSTKAEYDAWSRNNMRKLGEYQAAAESERRAIENYFSKIDGLDNNKQKEINKICKTGELKEKYYDLFIALFVILGLILYFKIGFIRRLGIISVLTMCFGLPMLFNYSLQMLKIRIALQKIKKLNLDSPFYRIWTETQFLISNNFTTTLMGLTLVLCSIAFYIIRISYVSRFLYAVPVVVFLIMYTFTDNFNFKNINKKRTKLILRKLGPCIVNEELFLIWSTFNYSDSYTKSLSDQLKYYNREAMGRIDRKISGDLSILTFLPLKEDKDFTEKYAHLTNSGIYNIESSEQMGAMKKFIDYLYK